MIVFFTEKVFSFLSEDEIEKLKQEEEHKIAAVIMDSDSSSEYSDEDDHGSVGYVLKIKRRHTNMFLQIILLCLLFQ